MEQKAKKVSTPIGDFKFPMNPAFTKQLEGCKTIEDLFELCEKNGFINPDAFAEICARGLTVEYKQWKERPF